MRFFKKKKYYYYVVFSATESDTLVYGSVHAIRETKLNTVSKIKKLRDELMEFSGLDNLEITFFKEMEAK